MLFVAAFWRLDPFTAEVVHDYGFQNFQTLWESDVYRAITQRTIADRGRGDGHRRVLAFPIAFYMAKVASPRTRNLLVVAILLPLWASYLVKVYAWRIILQEKGSSTGCSSRSGSPAPASATSPPGSSSRYLWLPFMILPVYAGLERIPGSLLEASADLGAHGGRTLRRVVLPLALPGDRRPARSSPSR